MNKHFDNKRWVILVVILICLITIIIFVSAFVFIRFSISEPVIRKIESSSLPAQVLWQIEIDEPVNKAPIITNNRVIISTSRAIYAIDTMTGQRFWKYLFPKYLEDSPLVTVDKIIYGDRAGGITALDKITGEIIWHTRTGDRVVTRIESNDQVLYFSTTPSSIIGAIDLRTGEMIWKITGADYDIPSRGATIRLVQDEVYVFTSETHILDAKTGQLKKSLPQDLTPTQFVNNKFYTGRSVREAESFRLINKLKSPSYIPLQGACESFRTPYIFTENVYYAAGNCGGVYALDFQSNQIVWRYREEVEAESPLAIYRDKLYVLFDNGEIHALDTKTGQNEGVLKSNLKIPGSIQNASFLSRGVVANEDVLIATFNDKNIWAFCEKPCFTPQK